MNLVMASVLLLAMLAFQPTLIYGTKKGLATAISHNNNRKIVKKHSLLSPSSSSLSSSAGAKLMMAFESADVLARSARGASDTAGEPAAAPVAPAAVGTTETNAAGGHQKNGSGNKRTKNNNNNKKLNRNSTPESSGSNSGRKHLDKKFSAAGSGAVNHQQQQRREQQHHGGNNNGNGNKSSKQRQLVKSQQHQNHGKRTGGKVKSESVEKTVDADKSQSTCRYAKSAWSECDVKTNMRSRTLTLKKGEANCLSTRTMQKKCKKTCRYEKGAWSECTNGLMTRQDKLKSTASSNPAAGDSNSCEAIRSTNKKCNPEGGAAKQPNGKAHKERKNKDKASRRRPAPQPA